MDWFDSDEEWAWNFIVDGKSMCVTGLTGNDNLPWTQALQWEADFTTQSSQLTLKVDAWEKDAPGEMCAWAHGDDPSQRVQTEIPFPAMSTGERQDWSRTMTFANRDSMPWDGYCRTTVTGYVTKITSGTVSVTHARVSLFLLPLLALLAAAAAHHGELACAAGAQEGMPRIMAGAVTLVNGVPQLRVTGKDLRPDPQELPVVQITGGGGTACITASLYASCTPTTPTTPTISTHTETVSNLFVVSWWLLVVMVRLVALT